MRLKKRTRINVGEVVIPLQPQLARRHSVAHLRHHDRPDNGGPARENRANDGDQENVLVIRDTRKTNEPLPTPGMFMSTAWEEASVCGSTRTLSIRNRSSSRLKRSSSTPTLVNRRSMWNNDDLHVEMQTMEQVLARYSLQLDDRPRPSSLVGHESGHNQLRHKTRTHTLRKKASKRRALMEAVLPSNTHEVVHTVTTRVRRSSIYKTYERAKVRTKQVERHPWTLIAYEYGVYCLMAIFIYFVLVGLPLWHGSVYYMYSIFQNNFILLGGWSIVIGIAFLYAFGPLLLLFEKDPPMPAERSEFTDSEDLRGDLQPGSSETALIIPCYKSAKIIGPTLVAALKVFPRSNIFVIANGNSETPLDNTEEVCRKFKVNHIWVPIGSKIVAQFVGCYAAKKFKNVLLIDDDCAIPPNFPIVSDRLTGITKSVGYTIKSTGPNSSKGTFCHQAQDLEYKLSGLQRAFAGLLGSATFPHGAISLWDREFLISTFHDHPGFNVSEDWFFGHSCRRLGGRIVMCTAIFVETETPDALFFSGAGGERGGFGEMTVFKQRFYRWNFFFVNGIFYDLSYIFFSWKLGWLEIATKLFVFQEAYETVLYILTPFVMPISFITAPLFSTYMFCGTIAMYLVNTIIFNEVHLRLKNESVSRGMLVFYYTPYKLILTIVNVFSCYYALFKYARYFAKPQLKVTEDEKAVRVVMELEEEMMVEDDTDRGNEGRGDNTATQRQVSVKRQSRVVVEALGDQLNFSSDSLPVSCAVGPPGEARATTLLPVSVSSTDLSHVRSMAMLRRSMMGVTEEDSSAIIDDEDDNDDDDDDRTLAGRSSMHSWSRFSFEESNMNLSSIGVAL